MAGFAVELVLNWVGKIRADGEITADAEEYPLPPVGGFGALGLEFDDDYEVVEVEGVEEIEEVEEEEDNDGATEAAEHRPKDRAKLSVSQKAPAPKQDAPKSGSRGPRKSSGKGGGPGLREEEHQEEGQRPWRPPIAMAGGDGRLSPLSTPSATRAVLEAHGIGTKYTLGQNFLVNDDVLKKIIALAEVDEADRVLEVGPGIGTLTIALLKHAASVVAIERDPDLPRRPRRHPAPLAREVRSHRKGRP